MNKNNKDKAKNLLYKWGNSSVLLEYEQKEAERIKQIIDSMTDISAMVYSNISRDKDGASGSPVEMKVIKSIDMCEERLERINKRIEEYINEEKIINEIIDQLDFEKQFIIKARYMNRLSWEEINKKYPCHMSLRTFYRLHNEALDEIWTIYNLYENN
jgi:hypothetical protein